VDTQGLFQLLQDGGLTVYPLTLGSIIALAIFVERIWRFRGIDQATRSLTKQIINALVERDLPASRKLCQDSKTPVATIYLDAMRWKNIAVEDLERVLATSRQEAASDLKRGLWIVGTIGSLAPYVGLFGTVVGIIRAFQAMSLHGVGGFEVVAAGISEALVATGAGLFVAITALAFFNYLQVRVASLSSVYARSCERFVQALLYIESRSSETDEESEASDGRLVPA
jgi:biopolymer transport protein ExbB